MKLVYRGPHRGVYVPLPDGREIEVAHGQAAEFPDEVADSLLEQAGNWEPAEKPSAAKAAKREE
jgi:hypothetical protein